MKNTATPLFNKLNLGTREEIAVFGAPDSFEAELKQLKGIKVLRDPKNPKAVKFGLAFATTQAQLDRISAILAAASEGDAVIWFAYPKGTSKRYTCEFNRDSGWSVIRGLGFESVRQVAIDEDWSALRFRRLEYVKGASAKPANLQPKRVREILEKLSDICVSLPEVERRDVNDHADYRVRGKVFAYFLNNHHGDNIVSVCCKSALGENVDRASREPTRFYLPPYIGPRGWFGLRLDGEAIDWSEVRNLVELSYRLVAPKRLVRDR